MRVALIPSIPSAVLVAVDFPQVKPFGVVCCEHGGVLFRPFGPQRRRSFCALPRIAYSTPDWVMPHPSSATFWGLMDRWDVSNDQAMKLVGYEGKLPTTGRRPRFRLSTEQAHVVATLLEVDSPLATAGLDPS